MAVLNDDTMDAQVVLIQIDRPSRDFYAPTIRKNYEMSKMQFHAQSG
jgi:hypothetical protein